MRMIRISVLAVLLLAAIYVSVMPAKTAGPPQRAVVVELFTSEGCSSCPPADALLGRLRQDLATKNIQVIPLGFHVDYWNGLGWKDRFSAADFSRRQEDYTQNLGGDGPYTPQMVVDGTAQFVGSDAGHAQQAISEAAAQPPNLEVRIHSAGADQLAIEVKAAATANDARVLFAITEDNLETKIGAGENGGRTLHHAAVVRELRQLGKVHDGGFTASVPLTLNKDWKRGDLRAVVFVQENRGGKIDGAASVALADQLR